MGREEKGEGGDRGDLGAKRESQKGIQAQMIQPEPHFWKIKWGKRD